MKLSPPQCLWTGTKCPGEHCEIFQTSIALQCTCCSAVSGVHCMGSGHWAVHIYGSACVTLRCIYCTVCCAVKKTSQECKTALTSQYWFLFLVFVFLSFCFFDFLYFCIFVFLSLCLSVILSRHHSDEMSDGSQVSKVTLCVEILKWQWVTT